MIDYDEVVFKITYPDRHNGSMRSRYYHYNEKPELLAFLMTLTTSGRMAIVTEGSYSKWRQQHEDDMNGVI